MRELMAENMETKVSEDPGHWQCLARQICQAIS